MGTRRHRVRYPPAVLPLPCAVIPKLADAYAKLSPRLAHRPGAALATRLHAKLVQATRGRIGRRMFGNDVAVLRTTGRRSGERRDTPVFYVRDGDALVAVAANAASPRPPAWWLNLQADPDAEAFVDGAWRPVRARRATAEEEARLWPRLVARYAGNEHYKTLAKRELPVVVLDPRG